jgi:hypothetical protein
LFSDSSRAVGAMLLPLLDSSSNSCATIPMVRALNLCSALAMFINNRDASQKAS